MMCGVLLHLDTHHVNIEETDLVRPWRPVRTVGDRLGCVHIGENRLTASRAR